MEPRRRPWRNSTDTPGLAVDEAVLAKVLDMNPGFQLAPARATAAPPAVEATTAQFETMVAAFVGQKSQQTQAALRDVASRRRALDAEEAHVKQLARTEIASFLSMLDPELMRRYGNQALRKQREALQQLGMSHP